MPGWLLLVTSTWALAGAVPERGLRFILDLDDVCQMRQGLRPSCAFSAIQVRGQRDQDLALLMDDECFIDSGHYSLSSTLRTTVRSEANSVDLNQTQHGEL
ncbi:unnamed protein product [Symbiodinium sp. CCMP2456]|nr:unnamed protein product [Symbiodinium sp. CCMP2456]